MKKLNILIFFLIIYCGGGEIAEEPTTTTTSTTTSTSTTTTVPEIIDFDKLFFEDYFGLKWNKENITWRFAEERMITASLEEEYSVIKPSINRITYTKKAFQLWGDAVNSINFKQSENSDNADITIGIVDTQGRYAGRMESTYNENNEITYATIIIENRLGGTAFLTTMLHEIGNLLGLGDIRPRQDIRSIQEDPFPEDFVGSSLWEFDVQMIKQLYDETTIPVETTTTKTIQRTECDESLSKVVAEDPSQVKVSIIQDAIYAEYYDDGESYIDEGILICWEPFLVDGFDSEDYWVVFGWTLDDYISADGSSFDTGVIYSVSSRYGPSGDEEPARTYMFFEYDYFYNFDEAKPYIENGKLQIYFQIEAINESSPNYWSEKTQTVSVTIDVP